MKRILEYILEYYLIKRCDMVITVSEGIAQELSCRYRIAPPLIIRNLDNRSQFPSQEERTYTRFVLNIPLDTILIAYQGALTRDRGIFELIGAMSLLPKNIHLLLMGPEPQEDILKQIRSNPRVHYPGMIPLNLLYKYTSSADIGIAPIKTSGLKSYSLAFPNKFSQYMNAGLALCLYDIKESREIFKKCPCGIVIPEITPESIHYSIKSLIENHDLEILKKNSKECFLKYYNWDIDREQLIKFFNSIFTKTAD